MCEDVIERVSLMLNVMIVSGLTQTIPYQGALSADADTKAQVIQRRTSTLGKLHNHPSGDPKPSAADIAITRDIVDATAAISVKVHDHLVIGRERVESFKSLGLL